MVPGPDMKTVPQLVWPGPYVSSGKRHFSQPRRLQHSTVQGKEGEED